DEQCGVERHKPILYAERRPEISCKCRFLKLRAKSWCHIGGHRNAAGTAMGIEGERGPIFARKLDKVGPAQLPLPRWPGEIAGSILGADDVGAILGEPPQRLDTDIRHRAARNVVDENRDTDGFRDRAEMSVN